MVEKSTYVIAAGGTGGHLFPAQALARKLLSDGHRVALITDARFEAYSKGFGEVEVYTIPSGRMGGGLAAKLSGVANILRGILAARKALKQLQPSVVIGFGGYPSFPTVQAAHLLNIPTVLHEQNKLLGRANGMLANGASAIAASFPETEGVSAQDQSKITLTGNPVRPEVLALAGQSYQLPETGEAPYHLLVFGGSQGAAILSEVVPQALALLPESVRGRLKVTQQCREEVLETTAKAYAEVGIEAELKPFFNDMARRLGEAHLVICRAGASTIAEMQAAGRPAIYVPYPHAADNHQALNALYLEDAEAGWVIPQSGLTPTALAARIEPLFALPETLKKVAANARKLAIVDATDRLASLVAQVGGAEKNDKKDAA